MNMKKKRRNVKKQQREVEMNLSDIVCSKSNQELIEWLARFGVGKDWGIFGGTLSPWKRGLL